MRRRLLLSTCLIALTAVVVLGLPLAFVGTELLHQRADNRLERRADAVALRLIRADAQGKPLTRALVADVLPAGQAVRITVDGRRRTLGAPPVGDTVEIDAGDAGDLQLALIAPAAARNDDVGFVWLAVAGSALAALLAAVVLATVQSRRLARPLERLADRVEQVGHGNYDDRPVAGHVPEIDRLQDALNGADRRIGELVRREREFTSNASHQLRSPLTGLRLRLEELRRLATTAAATDEADAALAQADRLVETIEHLERAGRLRDTGPPETDVAQVTAQHLAAERWAERFARTGRHLVTDLGPSAAASAHPETVRQIIDVLLDNALRHGAGATTIQVTPGEAVVLTVSDEGRRPAGAGEAVFARGVGDHTGIGLAVARELARDCGGDLRLRTDDKTTFEAAFSTTLADGQL